MKKLKVMIVDDEVTIVEGFKKLFDWDKHGCMLICEAGDGMSAINQANLYQPDIIIMDINLPIVNGLDAISMIREQNPNITFIVISGYDEFEYCQEALRLKVKDYILKPVKYEELGEVIDHIRMEQFHVAVDNKAPLKEEIKNEDSKIIFRFIAYIQEHLVEDISLQKLSQEFHMNPAYISQLFKNETGINYHSYLTRLRINKSKTLLTTTDKSISEIASAVGFSDYRVFTKMFKNYMSMTPSQYKSHNDYLAITVLANNKT